MNEMRLLVLRLTEKCNLQCAYCYAASDNYRPIDMSAQTAISAVSLCCPEGGKLKVQFTGGEPLLRLNVMEEVYAFGKRTGRKLSLSVQTNGTLLSPDVCLRLNAIRCGVGVSLDGIGSANALRCFARGEPAFDAIVAGIRNLGNVGMRCGLTTVVTNQNASELSQLVDLSLYLGNVSGIGLDLFRPIGRGAEQDFFADPDALEKGLRSLKQKTRQLKAAGVSFRFREIERLKKRKSMTASDYNYCYAQTDVSVCVDGNGDMWPCSSLSGNRQFFLGNIKNGLPSLSRASMECLKAPDQCLQCNSYSLCLGGCPAARQQGIHPLTCKTHHILSQED